MATAAQQSFAATYGPYAQQAGSRLGVDPNIILGQWGMETGWQTPSSGNLAGISPGGRLASYSSPQQFTDAYVTTIQNNFPGATNTGSDAQAFNNGLVNGRYGVYYQGNQAASLGQSTPTAGDQSAYLGSLQSAQNNNLIQYSGGAAPNSGTSIASTSPASTPSETISGTGTTTSTGTGTGTGTGSVTYTDPTTLQTTSASPSSVAGGQPGVLLDQPFQLGLTSGLSSAVNSWITNAETAVGNAFKQSFSFALSGMADWFLRGGLVVLGMILIAVALWRLMDPDGSKTKELIRSAGSGAEAVAA